MSALLANAILFSLFLFSLAMVLTLVRLFKGPSTRTASWRWTTCISWRC